MIGHYNLRLVGKPSQSNRRSRGKKTQEAGEEGIDSQDQGCSQEIVQEESSSNI